MASFAVAIWVEAAPSNASARPTANTALLRVPAHPHCVVSMGFAEVLIYASPLPALWVKKYGPGAVSWAILHLLGSSEAGRLEVLKAEQPEGFYDGGGRQRVAYGLKFPPPTSPNHSPQHQGMPPLVLSLSAYIEL